MSRVCEARKPSSFSAGRITRDTEKLKAKETNG